jgi:hypothetical protein
MCRLQIKFIWVAEFKKLRSDGTAYLSVEKNGNVFHLYDASRIVRHYLIITWTAIWKDVPAHCKTYIGQK